MSLSLSLSLSILLCLSSCMSISTCISSPYFSVYLYLSIFIYQSQRPYLSLWFSHFNPTGYVPQEGAAVCSAETHYSIAQSYCGCTCVEPLLLNKFSGGCGSDPSICCHATSVTTIHAHFWCPAKSTIYRYVSIFPVAMLPAFTMKTLRYGCYYQEKITFTNC